MASFTIDSSGNDAPPRQIPRFGRCWVTLNGVDTGWTADSGAPTFLLTGGAACILSQQIHSPTLATLLIDAGGSIATLTITDPQNSISATLTVASTFEESMVAKIESLLSESVGLTSVSLDGQTVSLQDLSDKRDFWLRRVNLKSGRRKRVSSINLARCCS